ncbi:FG-GAP-like repeat-containing protein [Streptomyces physcomitrii]|uniref:FG-GAP-like repeat-containing protein n=1 Tax=Streptomyces physcomitrii TaxID=2724184 RepID=UPI00342F202F
MAGKGPRHTARRRRWGLCGAAVLVAGTVTGAGAASAAPADQARQLAPAAVPDFNGDGYGDLAVGVPAARVGGAAEAGQVVIHWGGPDGPTTGERTTVRQGAGGVPGTAEKGDRFGASVDAADVDGDGRTDLVVGSPGEDHGAEGRGIVTVVWGGDGALDGASTLTKDVAPYGRLGASVIARDFDGDGAVDIAFDSHTEESGGLAYVPGPFGPGDAARPAEKIVRLSMGGGVARLAAGDFDGDGIQELAATASAMDVPITAVYDWRSGAPERLWGMANHGLSVAAGDFDGDGLDDLAVGGCRVSEQPGLCGEGESTGGRVHVLYGARGTFGERTQTVDQNTPGLPGDGNTDDDFGAALAAADTDGDGRAELAVGTPAKAIGSQRAAGRVVLLHGGADGLLDPTGTARAAFFHQDTHPVPGNAEAGDVFGTAVRLRDLNRDGAPELLIGSPGENEDSGGVWVLPGSSRGPVTEGSAALHPAAGAVRFGEVLGG